MTGTLRFNLDDPDDSQSFRWALHGRDAHFALATLDEWLRGKIKYAPDDLGDEVLDAYRDALELLRQECEGRGLVIDE